MVSAIELNQQRIREAAERRKAELEKELREKKAEERRIKQAAAFRQAERAVGKQQATRQAGKSIAAFRQAEGPTLARVLSEEQLERQRQEGIARQAREKSAAGRFFTGIKAFIPPLPGDTRVERAGKQARAEVQAVARTTRPGTGKTVLDVFGPPQTSTQALVEAAFLGIPVGRPAAAFGRGAKALGKSAAKAGRRATSSKLAARAGGREAAEEAARIAGVKPGRLSRAGTFFFGTPKRALITAGAGGAAGVATAGFLLGRRATQTQSGPGAPGDDETPGMNGGNGAAGDGGAGGAGGAGGGPVDDFAATSISLLEDLFGGVGLDLGFLDRIGEGIADLFRAVGVPVGENTGKLIFVGGVIIAGAFALREALPAIRKANAASSSSKRKTKAKGKKKGNPKSKAKTGNPSTPASKGKGKAQAKATRKGNKVSFKTKNGKTVEFVAKGA